MKKIIPLVLVVLILAFAAFFFFNNHMAMTTLISQDYGIIAKVYNKGMKGVTKHNNFYYENITKKYKNGDVSTSRKEAVSIIFDGENVSKIFGTVLDNDNGYEIEVYYVVEEGVATTYVTRTPKGEEPNLTIYSDATADDVLDTILEIKPVLMPLKDVETMTTIERLTQYKEQDKAQFKDKVKSTFSFSPFGAKYELKTSDTESYIAAIDIFGKLHEITHKVGTATEYTATTTDFKKYNKRVTIYWKNNNAFKDVTPESFTVTP